MIRAFPENEEHEAPVYLRLVDNGDGVDLVAVDATGEMIDGGYILEISGKGKATLVGSVSDKIGLVLDKGGKLKL